MIYHITGDGVYSRQFYELMRKYREVISIPQHFVFINSVSKTTFSGRNTSTFFSFWSLFFFFIKLKKSDRVVLHSYNHPWLYILCFIFWWRLNKMAWVIWGYDLYFYNSYTISLKFRMYEFLRRKTIRSFGFIVTDVFGDFEIAREVYRIKGTYLDAGYPSFGLVGKAAKVEERASVINILLGNSADPSNRHFEMLNVIDQYADENFKVYMPLSYGGDAEYINMVISKGKSMLGSKFIPVIKFMEYEDYATFLKTIDVMICLHDRQQAQGNLWIVLSNGGKVYMNSNVSTFKMFKEHGLCVYSIGADWTESFDSFVSMPVRTREENNSKINEYFSLHKVVEKWKVVYKCMLK
jgi:dTDP-N-acetylfucosamine:lipid II N-acetylfucosaminyltransferase